MSTIHPEVQEGGDDVAARGIPPLTKRRKNNKWVTIALAGLALVVVLALAAHIALKKLSEGRGGSQTEKKAEVAPALPDMTRSAFDRAADADKATKPPEATPAANPTPPPGAAAAQGTQQPQLTAEQKAAKDLAERRKRAPLVVSAGGDAGAGSGSSPSQSGGDDAQTSGQHSRSSLGDAMTATRTGSVGATRMANPSLTIATGQFLDCNLITAINSDQPGMTSCVLAHDVYSTNGRVLLLERGSRVTGQYQSAQLKQGQRRIFVLWTRIETPSGVLVNLDSPSTDPVGRSGVDGVIDMHFWTRFGSALLMSLVDDVSSYAQNQAAQNGSGIQFTNTAQSGQNAASIIVQNTVNIPPTLDKAQGSHIGVFVARDLSFENVYALRASR